jgi:hypothetical protein
MPGCAPRVPLVCPLFVWVLFDITPSAFFGAPGRLSGNRLSAAPIFRHSPGSTGTRDLLLFHGSSQVAQEREDHKCAAPLDWEK